MSRVGTILLLLLAVGVVVFLVVIEPRWTSTREELASRDHVLRIDPARIRGIRVSTGDTGFELSRRDDGWRVGPKPRDFASPKMVGELLGAAANLRVFDVIRADELRRSNRSLDDFGLENPRTRLDLLGDGDEALLFGREAAGDGRIYVRREKSDDVYVVSDELQRLAFRNPQDFRDRRLTPLAPSQIDRFTIKRGLGEIALERGGQGWEIVRPLRSRADDATVEALLRDLLGLNILEFIADESDDLSAYGLGEPRAELILQAENEARPLALRIGAEAKPGAVLAQFTGRDSVYHLPEKAWTRLQVNPDDLRDRHLLRLNLDTVDAIRLRNGKSTRTIERSGDAWRSGDQSMNAAAIEEFVDRLNRTKVVRYLPITAENLRRAGLDRPTGEIAFDAWLSENTPETTAGRRAVASLAIGAREGKDAYVRLDDAPEIGVIPAAVLDGLAAPAAGR